MAEYAKFETIIAKTGGEQELRAFVLLHEHAQEFARAQASS
jgi:hypothetical protein